MKHKSLLLLFSIALMSLFSLSGFALDAQSATQLVSVAHFAGSIDPSMLVGLAGLTIQSMREQRTALVTEARNLHEKMPAKPSETETKAYDEKIEQISNLDGQIKREQELLDLGAEKRFADKGAKVADLNQSEARKLYAKWLRGGDKSLSAEDWTSIRNTMSTTTTTEGGFTVQSEVASELIRALKEFGGMREAAQVFATEQGNPLSFPTNDATAEVGELIAENAPATDLDPSFGTVSLNAFKYGSKVVTVPIELLMDSQIDIEAFVRDLITERLGRITNQHYTTGTGTGQPRGIVTGSSLGKTGLTGQTTTIIYDDVVDLQHSVDPAYRRSPGAGFMTSDAGLKMLRKVKDTQGRPIFVPGYEMGTPGGAPDTLLGSRIYVNNDIAVPAANAKSVIYGDLRKYKIRDVLMVTMQRFTDSAYAKKGQVGFLAWMRTGGNLVDTAAVKHYINSAT